MPQPRSPLFVARAVVMALALLALLATLSTGPGIRFGVYSVGVGFAILKYATFAGLAAALGAVILAMTLVVPRLRTQPWVPVLALCFGLAAAAPALMLRSKAESLPYIHDVSTDLADPPGFVALAQARKASPNGLAHGGAKVAEEQRRGYPDIKPLLVKSAPGETVQRAIDAARSLGWEIAAADAAAGRIEATDTTLFFGFKDDVVVRIRPEGTGSRVDVRSVSRLGESDIGANAERIRKFLAKLA